MILVESFRMLSLLGARRELVRVVDVVGGEAMARIL